MTQTDIQFLISAVLFVAGAFAVCLFEPFLDYLENKKNRENAQCGLINYSPDLKLTFLGNFDPLKFLI